MLGEAPARIPGCPNRRIDPAEWSDADRNHAADACASTGVETANLRDCIMDVILLCDAAAIGLVGFPAPAATFTPDVSACDRCEKTPLDQTSVVVAPGRSGEADRKREVAGPVVGWGCGGGARRPVALASLIVGALRFAGRRRDGVSVSNG